MRVLLADDDVTRADAVGQELRARGANVVITDTRGTRLRRAAGFDPSVLVIGEHTLAGEGYGLLQRMREDVRLRWAYLLWVAWEDIWSDDAPGPMVSSLIHKLGTLRETERSLKERAQAGLSFDARLEATGPARLLRTLSEAQRSLRMTLHNRRVSIHVDLAEGLIAGASCELLEQPARHLRGSTALAALLQTGSGRVHVEPVVSPANANVMAPIDAALMSALNEAAPLRPSEPAPSTAAAQTVGSLRAGKPARSPLPPSSGKTKHGYKSPLAQAPTDVMPTDVVPTDVAPPAVPPPRMNLGQIRPPPPGPPAPTETERRRDPTVEVPLPPPGMLEDFTAAHFEASSEHRLPEARPEVGYGGMEVERSGERPIPPTYGEQPDPGELDHLVDSMTGNPDLDHPGSPAAALPGDEPLAVPFERPFEASDDEEGETKQPWFRIAIAGSVLAVLVAVTLVLLWNVFLGPGVSQSGPRRVRNGPRPDDTGARSRPGGAGIGRTPRS